MTKTLKYDEPLAIRVVNFLELIFSGSNEYSLSIIEQILEDFDFTTTPDKFKDSNLFPPDSDFPPPKWFPPPGATYDWYTIKHGLFKLAEAFTQLPSKSGDLFGNYIQYNCEVKKIEVDKDKKLHVTYDRTSERTPVTMTEVFDRVVITAPFNSVRFWDLPFFSLLKRTAIRKLHYGEAAKVFTVHNKRFWEEEGIKGGSTYSDLTARVTVYSGYQPDRNPDVGVLLGSYTWDQDAIRFIIYNNNPEAAVKQTLNDLDKIHGNDRASKTYDNKYAFKVWDAAYAFFEAGQFATCYPDAFCPEFRIHFAGEHTSMFHAWIVGALNSSYRVVEEILNATAPQKLKEFHDLWPCYEYDE